MKKSIFLAVAAVVMTACSNDVDLGMKDANKQTADNAIGFQVLKSNMSRATTTSMESNGHYNFGVWAYKDNDHSHEIMANYLVGYFGTEVGYSKDGASNSTYGSSSSLNDHVSLWGYEGLGNTEYNWDSNTGTQKFYLDTDDKYKSNNAIQYLRYFDYSSTYTEFFAYAPYIYGSATPTFTIAGNKLTFPEGSIKDGYNDTSLYEYLCAYTKVANSGSNYNTDVDLTFKHLNSKIRIVFYEEVAGYSVKMLPLHTDAGIIAVPTKFTSPATYEYADNTFFKEAKSVVTLGSTINFGAPEATKYYTGTAGDAISATDIYDKALVFKAPVASELKEDRSLALADNDSYSKDIYYGIPQDNSCGLTFRVSFELTSTTGETIKVYNAGVHVGAANCVWKAGKSYTYVFKITKNATGDTGTNTPTVDPNPGTQALYPIVFDNIQVEDWTDVTDPSGDGSHNIN